MIDFDLKSEESRVGWIIMNTYLNGNAHDCYRLTEDQTLSPYNYYEEAMLWAKGKNYFPELSEEEVLLILRKYDIWNEFEKAYGKDNQNENH